MGVGVLAVFEVKRSETPVPLTRSLLCYLTVATKRASPFPTPKRFVLKIKANKCHSKPWRRMAVCNFMYWVYILNGPN